MSDNENIGQPNEIEANNRRNLDNRRAFLKFGGACIAALAFAHAGTINSAHAAEPNPNVAAAPLQQQTINLGTGDVAV